MPVVSGKIRRIIHGKYPLTEQRCDFRSFLMLHINVAPFVHKKTRLSSVSSTFVHQAVSFVVYGFDDLKEIPVMPDIPRVASVRLDAFAVFGP